MAQLPVLSGREVVRALAQGRDNNRHVSRRPKRPERSEGLAGPSNPPVDSSTTQDKPLVLLADEGPGDGGIGAVAGSRKANLPCLRRCSDGSSTQEHVTEINARAGDAVIFSEACTHGTLPWNADHQRRAILCKYNTGHMAWGGGGLRRARTPGVGSLYPRKQLVKHGLIRDCGSP